MKLPLAHEVCRRSALPRRSHQGRHDALLGGVNKVVQGEVQKRVPVAAWMTTILYEASYCVNVEFCTFFQIPNDSFYGNFIWY